MGNELIKNGYIMTFGAKERWFQGADASGGKATSGGGSGKEQKVHENITRRYRERPLEWQVIPKACEAIV